MIRSISCLCNLRIASSTTCFYFSYYFRASLSSSCLLTIWDFSIFWFSRSFSSATLRSYSFLFASLCILTIISASFWASYAFNSSSLTCFSACCLDLSLDTYETSIFLRIACISGSVAIILSICVCLNWCYSLSLRNCWASCSLDNSIRINL